MKRRSSAVLAALLLASSPVHAADPIKIGAVLPFSGGVELYGQQAKLGLDLAARDINAAGGILGHPVEVIYRDNKTDPAVATAVMQDVVERESALAVVGPITSRNFDAVAAEAERLRTPLLYATNYEGGKCGRYIFSLSTVPNQELAQLLPYMMRNFGNTFFLLGADRVWPHKMFDAAEPMIAQLGGKIVGRQYTLGTERDFTALIDQVAASKAKILLFALKGDGMQFIPQAEDRGLFKDMTVAFLGLSETDLGVFGGKGQNMYAAVPFVARSEDQASKAFVGRIGAGATVSNYVVTHYDALMAVKAALEKAGKVDKEALIDALEGLSLMTPTGKVTIGKDHHTTMSMFLAKTEGHDLVPVSALGQIVPQPGCR